MASIRSEEAAPGLGGFAALAPAGALFAACLLTFPALAGITLSFQGLTNNNAFETTVAESQLFMTVDGVGNTVSFTLSNTGPVATSATDVYFDDDALLGSSQVFNGPDTGFGLTVSPASLPGGNLASPAFETSKSFSAAAQPLLYVSGVNASESVTMTFELIGQQTFADVLSDLASGALRIGVRMQTLETASEETVINSPVPAAGPLGILAAAGLVLGRRRR